MLPIRKVVLYKHGVGYFEREGEIDGNAPVDLHFRASEMNDVLKSLTVLDLQGGLVSSVSYESTKPVDKQLEDIAIRIPDQGSLTGLLAQLKGARVAVELGPSRVEGLIAGIETVTRKTGDTTSWDTLLTLLVDGGSLRTFDVLEIKSVSFLDEGLRKDLQHLLDILLSAKKKDLKKLTIFTRGEGRRRVQASYVVETPVWKTSYRLLLGGDQPLVQGWAIVDNTQDEDWEDVSLSLVAGLPVSFVHDLYSPRYKRRPVVQVKEDQAYAPPVLEAAEEALATDGAPPPPGGFGMPAPALTPQMAAAPPMPRAPAPMMRAAAMRSSAHVQTRTAEVGDQFHYAIANLVTVRRNQSALVPILQAAFEGKRVAVYNPEVRDKNPMSAVLFKNTTGMTLEAGPVTVFEDDAYVGESMLDLMKPSEQRLVPFSVELGCQVTTDARSEVRDVHYVVVRSGTVHLHRYRIQRQTYVIQNKTPKPMDLFLDHRFVHGWELIDTDPPAEKTDSYYRFRLTVPANATTRFTVSEKGDQVEAIGLSDVRRDQIRVWAESRYLDAEAVSVLETLADLSDRIADYDRKVAEREQEMTDLFQNQERLRKNLQALGSSHDEKGLRERYVAELSAEEDRHQHLRREIAELKGLRSAADATLRTRIREIRFEKLVGG